MTATEYDEAAAILARRPLPPQDLAARVNGVTVTLSWLPPAPNGGAPPANYLVGIFSASGAVRQWREIDGDRDSYTTPPLPPGPTAFHVVAKNAAGASTPAVVNQTVLKPLLAGLIDTSGSAAAHYPIGAVTAKLAWKDLEPVQGTLNPAVLERAVARSGGLPLLVRLMCGTSSPDWAMQIGGGPVLVGDPQDVAAAPCPRFWLSEFQDAVAAFYLLIGALLEPMAQVPVVTISGAMTVYAEPFRRGGGTMNAAALDAAGYSVPFDLAAETRAANAALAAFSSTRLSWALNPFDVQGEQAPSWADTLSQVSFIRGLFGPRVVLENNSIRWPRVGGQYTPMYDYIAGADSNPTGGPPCQFQTATLARIGADPDPRGGLLATLADAAAMKACAVELPPDYEGVVAPADLDSAATLLVANAQATQ
jgi:hypothetical protein